MYKVNDVVVHENGGVYRIVSIGKPDFVKGQEAVSYTHLTLPTIA